MRTAPQIIDHLQTWASDREEIRAVLLTSSQAAPAGALGYLYPEQMDADVTAYLVKVRNLPRDAAAFPS